MRKFVQQSSKIGSQLAPTNVVWIFLRKPGLQNYVHSQVYTLVSKLHVGSSKVGEKDHKTWFKAWAYFQNVLFGGRGEFSNCILRSTSWLLEVHCALLKNTKLLVECGWRQLFAYIWADKYLWCNDTVSLFETAWGNSHPSIPLDETFGNYPCILKIAVFLPRTATCTHNTHRSWECRYTGVKGWRSECTCTHVLNSPCWACIAHAASSYIVASSVSISPWREGGKTEEGKEGRRRKGRRKGGKEEERERGREGGREGGREERGWEGGERKGEGEGRETNVRTGTSHYG